MMSAEPPESARDSNQLSGPGSDAFDGILDNTDVGKLLIKYLQ